MRKIILAVLALTLLTACSTDAKGVGLAVKLPATVTVTASPTPSAAPLTLQIYGDLTLLGDNSISATGTTGEPCTELGVGYSDIVAGAQVTITSPTGAVIGVGTLKAGIAIAPTSGTGRINCLFDFDVSGLPAALAFYGVTISHRGTVQFTAAQIEANQVDLSLGP